jgi:hypothetical protein
LPNQSLRTEGGELLSSQPSLSESSLDAAHPAPQIVSLGWALRRAALWFSILAAMVVVGAWLYDASIDRNEAAANAPLAAEAASSSR